VDVCENGIHKWDFNFFLFVVTEETALQGIDCTSCMRCGNRMRVTAACMA